MRIWNRGGSRPENIEFLGAEAWNRNGIIIFVSPLNNEKFIQEVLRLRLEDEQQKLWTTMCGMRDLQCAWQILVRNCGPNTNHILRTVDPQNASVYANSHELRNKHNKHLVDIRPERRLAMYDRSALALTWIYNLLPL